MSWTSEKRRRVMNYISETTAYVNNQLPQEIEEADKQLSSYLNSNNEEQLKIFEEKKRNIDANLNIIKFNRKRLTDLLSNTEMQSQRQKLREIGELQQTNKAKKETLKTLNDELKVAEAREDAIKNRNTDSSYAQTFGYIFRPFRRASYAVIVPLIFVMICAAVYLVWTAPTGLKLNKGASSILPMPSAPPVNNFNKQMKEFLK